MARRLKAHDTSKTTRHKAEPVEVRNIAHPKVWKLALSVAGNDAKRIQVVRYGECVILLNN